MNAFRRFFVCHQAHVRLGQACAPHQLHRDVVTRELTDAYKQHFPKGVQVKHQAPCGT